MNLLSFIKPVYAHCDIPCGIYETDTMKHAAQTCLRMTQGLTDTTDTHDIARLTLTKEEHGRKLKHELYVLWSDYFKPEHLEAFPDLHERFWKTIKQVSTVKQHVSVEDAEKLVGMVDDIATMFTDSKK